MRIFVKRIFYFSLLVVIPIAGINLLQRHFNNDCQYYRLDYEELFRRNNEYTGIIIGNSQSAMAIRPSLLDSTGISFFNYSTNAANPTYLYNWYNLLFSEYNATPEYFIVAVNWFFFNNNTETNFENKRWLDRTIEQDSEFFPFSAFVKLLISDSGISRKKLVANRFPFWKYRKQIISSLKLQRGSPLYYKEGYDRGFYPRKSLAATSSSIYTIPYTDFTINSPEITEMSIDYKEVENFKKLINTLHSSGSEVIFVMCPEYGIKKEYYDQMEAVKIFYQISQKYDITFFNFNGEHRGAINNDISKFSDWEHLNKEGSAEFSKDFATRIINSIN